METNEPGIAPDGEVAAIAGHEDPEPSEVSASPPDERANPERLDVRADLRLLAKCFWSPEGLAGTLAMVMAIVMWTYFAKRPFGPVSSELMYWISHLIGLVALPLALAWIGFGAGPRELGLGWGRPRVWGPVILACAVIVAPAIVWAGGRGEFQRFYPLWDGARISPEYFLLHQVVMLSVIFANEFFFRGYMIGLFSRRMPPSAAIVCAMVPYAWGHAAKPLPEFFSSIMAGLALGFVVWRGKSIWPGVLLHFAVSMTIDVYAAREVAATIPHYLLGLVGLGG
jgi:membrane protease YdiL (CAAX protease family)